VYAALPSAASITSESSKSRKPPESTDVAEFFLSVVAAKKGTGFGVLD
jgi:hypothetical protein